MLHDILSQYLGDIEDSIRKLDRYHFQDQQNNLIFRYDNTPHFPNLKTFPHHKHLNKKIEASTRPQIFY